MVLLLLGDLSTADRGEARMRARARRVRSSSASWCSIGGGGDTVGRKRMRQRRSDEWKTGNGEIDGVGRGGDCVNKRGILSVIMGGDRTVRELDVPGEIYERKTYAFEFATVEMPYESYNGTNVRLRYILKVTIGRNYVGSIVESRDFCVRNYSPVPTINNSIKMEVGIEDCLHIEFEYSKSKYHLKDVIIGKIYFLLVRIKIKNMELEIRRRESTGSGPNTYVETETLAKFELMDGAPVRGESIPVRLFLTPYELTPTYRNINNKFSVKYYLNLVLVDEEDHRYFKQQEITMYRLLETPQSS
ncbi:vacuolar protein sorting-associated protein 26A [Sorghum bicolor]|uniref:vacuolar protein sorting-associated protein 26A n=1 Tax=Sorghum bicolor TaxID=4558 RepID=UPI000B423B00|nr:vacuolar protein sorting-associated protein 26A [Sorghum bicolor]|eukprot:XP_002451161.2 vacuolar protein sorting-associated protein 26A [Sorghum bicolor]